MSIRTYRRSGSINKYWEATGEGQNSNGVRVTAAASDVTVHGVTATQAGVNGLLVDASTGGNVLLDSNTVSGRELSSVPVEKRVDGRLTVVVDRWAGVKVFGDEHGRFISCRDDQLGLVDPPFIFTAIAQPLRVRRASS